MGSGNVNKGARSRCWEGPFQLLDEDEEYVDVVNFDRYNMIIGTPFMRRNKVKLDFEKNEVVINGQSLPAIKVTNQDLDARLRRHRATDKKQEWLKAAKTEVNESKAATVATSERQDIYIEDKFDVR